MEDDGHLLQQTVQGMLKETKLEVVGEEELTELGNQLEQCLYSRDEHFWLGWAQSRPKCCKSSLKLPSAADSIYSN